MDMLKTLGIATMALALSASVGVAQDGQRHGHGGGFGTGPGHGMMDMMGRMQGMMGMAGDMSGMGMSGMGGIPGMGEGMMRMLDEDGDGDVTVEEARSALDDLRAEYDADDDGTLSINEFETLHSAFMRSTMVDRFQHLDSDGDGEITAEEMTAPVDRMERMQTMRDRRMRGDGTGEGRMMEDGRSPMMDGQGPMMDGDRSGMQDRQGN